jgi:hypothetical protein
MDYKQIAAEIIIFLSPFLPYLVSAGEETAKEIGKRFGETGFEMVKSLWSKIKNSAKDTQKLNGVATALATDPDNEHLQSALAEIVAKQLASSPKLAGELINLMKNDQAVQKILVEEGSKVKDIYQRLSKFGGDQSIVVRGSQADSITQEQ